MKPEHKLYGAVALVLVLGIGAYVATKDKKQDFAAHTADGKAADLPTVKLTKEDAEKVTKFVLKNKDEPEVVLEKKGDAWTVVKPVDAPADAQAVKSIVENLEKIEVKDVIADTADVHEKYELTDATALHAQVFKGEEKVLDMYFGKKGGRGQMARMAGDKPTVYLVDGYSSYSWAKDLKGWRDKAIFDFEDGNVIAAEVENKNGKFSFTKDGESWAAKFYERGDDGELGKGKAIDRFDAAKVKDMLKAYKKLKATDFAADGDDTGVSTPLEEGGVVRFTMKDDDAPKYIATLGKTNKGTNRYLVKEGDPTVYIVTSWAADWATAAPEKFQKPEDKKDGEGEGEGDDEPPVMPALDMPH